MATILTSLGIGFMAGLIVGGVGGWICGYDWVLMLCPQRAARLPVRRGGQTSKAAGMVARPVKEIAADAEKEKATQ